MVNPFYPALEIVLVSVVNHLILLGRCPKFILQSRPRLFRELLYNILI